MKYPHARQASNRYNRFHDTPGEKSLFHRQMKIFFEQPETAIVYMRKHQTPCADR